MFFLHRYSDDTSLCSEDEAKYLACDSTDNSPSNVHSAARYCGRFARTCALYCAGDKNAPDCQLISPCQCIDEFSFAPMHGLACQGYAQRCNTTEWLQCGLYAATCIRSTVNETGSITRYTDAEPGDTTCTCLSGISPAASGDLPCHATRVTSDGVTLRACTLSEARSACGLYAASCQYHIGLSRALPTTCACNASSVTIYASYESYESRITPPSISCPGPWALRNCTRGEQARCEQPLAQCLVNVTLTSPQGVLLNGTGCFPNHYDYPCACTEELARQKCGTGYVGCTTLGVYNQLDGCFNLTNTSVQCTCDTLYANYSKELGYACLNETSVVRNCTANEYQAFCGPPIADGLSNRCFAFALNGSLVNGTCSRALVVRDCSAAELAFMCPLFANTSVNQTRAYCKAIAATNGVVYQTINASCPAPSAPAPFVAPSLAPANSTGYPRQCRDDESARECSHDRACEVYSETRCNLTESERLQLGLLYEFMGKYAFTTNLSSVATIPAAFRAINITFCNLTNITVGAGVNASVWELSFDFACDARFNASANKTVQCVQFATVNTTQCTQVMNRTALCVANGPSNYTCTCQPGYGPLNPRYEFTSDGFIRANPLDVNLGKCEGVVRDCEPGEETLVFGGRYAQACQISCNANDRTQNCIVYNATCDALQPSLPGLTSILPFELAANELSAFFPVNIAQPCGSLGWLYDQAAVMNLTIDLGVGINITSEIQRRCGSFVDKASFMVFDCNVTHSLCEPYTRYALYMFSCTCEAGGFRGPSLPCETDYYTRPCNATEDALVPRGAFDDTCMRSYTCRLLCYPATATQPEICFRHAPDPCESVCAGWSVARRGRVGRAL